MCVCILCLVFCTCTCTCTSADGRLGRRSRRVAVAKPSKGRPRHVELTNGGSWKRFRTTVRRLAGPCNRRPGIAAWRQAGSTHHPPQIKDQGPIEERTERGSLHQDDKTASQNHDRAQQRARRAHHRRRHHHHQGHHTHMLGMGAVACRQELRPPVPPCLAASRSAAGFPSSSNGRAAWRPLGRRWEHPRGGCCGLLRAAAALWSAGQCAWDPAGARRRRQGSRDALRFLFWTGDREAARASWLNRLHGSSRQATCNKLAGSGSGPGWTTPSSRPNQPAASSQQPATARSGSGNNLDRAGEQQWNLGLHQARIYIPT